MAPGVGFRANGSLTVATNPAELALMEEVAAQPEAGLRQLTVLDADDVRPANAAVRGRVLGGLLCRRDAVVEPGAVLGALRGHLADNGGYRWLPGRRAVEVGSGIVVDHVGDVHRGVSRPRLSRRRPRRSRAERWGPSWRRPRCGGADCR